MSISTGHITAKRELLSENEVTLKKVHSIQPKAVRFSYEKETQPLDQKRSTGKQQKREPLILFKESEKINITRNCGHVTGRKDCKYLKCSPLKARYKGCMRNKIGSTLKSEMKAHSESQFNEVLKRAVLKYSTSPGTEN